MRFAVLFAAALLAPLAGAEEPLRRGRDVIFVRPTTTIGYDHQVALEFETLGPDQDAQVSERILGFAPLAREVRDYRSHRRSRGLVALPLYVALARGFVGTTYCVRQGFLLHTPLPSGESDTQFRIAPVVTLSGSSLKAIEAGKGEEGLGVLCHEAGHALMSVAYPLPLYPGSAPEGLRDLLTSEGHWYGKVTDPLFAYSEGWAEFCEFFYTNRALPPTLLQTREGQGPQAKTRPLTAEEIRKCEGAQAYLLLAVARAVEDEDIVRRWLSTMARSRPRTMMELLARYVEAHPERGEAVEKAVAEASGGRFHVDKDYGAGDLFRDQADSWRRLGEALADRLRALRKAAEGGEKKK
ncbi:MAG: hypothetical protein HYZ53_09195 [Planctomycetes bacterium]|nr:hypothetical protein [Planctomycetota bacterium]